MIILIDKENTSDKIPHPFLTKSSQQTMNRETSVSTCKEHIQKNPQLTSYSTVRNWTTSP